MRKKTNETEPKKRGRKPKNPADFGKQFEDLKITKPTPYDNMPCGNPYIEDKEVEEDVQEPKLETEFVMPKKTKSLTTEELIAKIKQTLVAVCHFCSCDVEIYKDEIVRSFSGGNASLEITYGTTESTRNFRHFKIKYRESDAAKFAELVEALKEWSN